MPPNWQLVEEFFKSKSTSYWVERLEKLMKDNEHLSEKSNWYVRLKRTRDLLAEDKIDCSVMLSVIMADVGL